jgi:phosphate transport system substrate-binding protein
MRSFRAFGVVGLALMMAALGGCRTNTTGGGKEERLNIGGATFIYPMMDKWSFEYQKVKGAKVSYNSSGSGTGIQQMIAKTLDFGCSDAPLTDKQLEEAKAQGGEVIHIPLAMGGVAIAYNLKELDKPLVFNGPVLADIFLGKITNWNDKTLQELNPDAKLPDKKIAVCHRADGSGTTNIFADYLSKVSPEWKEKVGVSTSLKFPVGVGAKGSEGVTGFVKDSDGAITYVEMIYALNNKIPFGALKNQEGATVLPSLESVTAAANNGLANIPDDLRYSLTNMPGKDAYPIAGTNWAVLYVKQPAAKAETIKNFLHWVTHDGQAMCEALHYAKLPPGLVEKLEKKLQQVKPAT